MTLRSWFDKLMGLDKLTGRGPKPPPAPAEPTTFPSQRTLTPEEQAERDKADEPHDRPGPNIHNP